MSVADTTIHPPGTVFSGVRSPQASPRPWLEHLPTSTALQPYHVLHAGTAVAPPGYRIVRMRQTSAFFLATLSGEGRVLVGGKWQRAVAGTAAFLPPCILNAFETHGSGRWTFCWVCRTEPRDTSLPAGGTPTIRDYNAAPLEHAIAGLAAEASAAGEATMEHLWASLIHRLVARFSESAGMDSAFTDIWAGVAAEPAANWDLGVLAKSAGCSREKLRRLCLQHFGRTPMQQVSHIRLQRAAALLADGHDKLEAIASDVGYANGFILSKAFLRWSGQRPSEFRRMAPRREGNPALLKAATGRSPASHAAGNIASPFPAESES